MSGVGRSKKMAEPRYIEFTAEDLRQLKGALVQFKTKTGDKHWKSIPLQTGIITRVDIHINLPSCEMYTSNFHICTTGGVVLVSFLNRSIRIVCLEGGSEYSDPVPLWSHHLADDLRSRHLAEEEIAEECRA
jgi:hypothetical protein